MRARRAKEAGYSLIETLVAIAIIAGALGVTAQVISSGARQTRAVEDRRLAILVAQSQMAAVGAAQNSRFGDSRGVTDGVRWRIAVKPWSSGVASPVRLEEVVVTTGLETGGDLFTLRTIRVAR